MLFELFIYLFYYSPKLPRYVSQLGSGEDNFFIFNVYFKCFLREREMVALRREILLRTVSLRGEVWCVLWDFKSVCSSAEQIGGDRFVLNVINANFINFSSFIFDMDILDLPILGRRFTLYQLYGAASYLDRIHISKG